MPKITKLKNLKKVSTPKIILGWREWAALPVLGICRIKVKIDTGARNSALHAFNYSLTNKNGGDWISFDVHPNQKDDNFIKSCTTRLMDRRWVTNSGGASEKRFVIETPIRIGEREWPIIITLSNRDEMGFRMLVGRTAIKGKYLVDPGKSFCCELPNIE